MTSVSVSVINVVAMPNFPARPVRPVQVNELSLASSRYNIQGVTVSPVVTYSVAVVRDLVGAVEVEHIGHVRDVQPSACHVRRDQYLNLAAAEHVQSLFSLYMTQVHIHEKMCYNTKNVVCMYRIV